MSLPMIFIVVACVLWALAFFSVPASRFNLVAGGLFFFGLSFLIR